VGDSAPGAISVDAAAGGLSEAASFEVTSLPTDQFPAYLLNLPSTAVPVADTPDTINGIHGFLLDNFTLYPGPHPSAAL
jgi:hypothetical protein